MAQEITTRRDIPTPTPQIAKSLSPQERIDHRQMIASEVKTVLSAYFQPHEDDSIKSAQLAWWCDELEDWTREQVVWALRKWNRDNPRWRPTPGDIVSICKKQRGMKLAKEMRETPPKEPKDTEPKLTAEDKARIAAELGLPVLTPKRMTE